MPPSFTVISQVAQLVKNPQGQYVQGYRVTAQLASGSTIIVDVPAAQYNAEAVKALLRAQAEAVGELDGYSE
jgi:hypothetical protein